MGAEVQTVENGNQGTTKVGREPGKRNCGPRSLKESPRMSSGPRVPNLEPKTVLRTEDSRLAKLHKNATLAAANNRFPRCIQDVPFTGLQVLRVKACRDSGHHLLPPNTEEEHSRPALEVSPSLWLLSG